MKMTSTTTYDAGSIKILTPEQVEDKFEWAKLHALSIKYGKPFKWIENGFESCRRCGVDPDYFVARYLDKTDVERIRAVEDAYRDLTREAA
jgi:hypothetical protein